MASPIKSVIVVGAGGHLGQGILPIILDAGLKVSVLARPESTSSFPSDVNVVKASYEPSALKRALSGQDAVVSLIASSMIPEQNKIIDAAADAGVKWFIPSEFGSDTRNPVVVEHAKPFFDGKVSVVKHLRAKESSGLSWTSFITGPFWDWGTSVGFTGFDVKTRTAEIWGSGDIKFSTTNLNTIGRAIVNLLTSAERLDAAKNRYVVISSFTATQNEILKIFEEVSGEKWNINRVDAEKAGSDARRMLEKGEVNQTAFRGVVLSALYGEPALGDHEKAGTDNDLLLPNNNENLAAQLKTMVEEAK